ncbi:MAG: hypothetical protein KAT25_06370 [Sulfuriflexus sp.]|nr:hypothetical protein [Sulfuriflexus sp.]
MKDDMLKKIETLANWIDNQSLRERALILFAIIFAIFLVWEKVLLDPLDAQAKQLKVEIKKKNKELTRVRDQQTQILERASSDPDSQVTKDIEAVRAAIKIVDERLQRLTGALIEPAKMAEILEDVLTRETDLKLVSVEALAPKPLTEFDDSDKKGAKRSKHKLPGVYQHAMRIEFQGSYLSTLNYMRELEELSQQFYWGSIDFSVENYPQARVVITVNTLSLNEAWIGV